MKKGRVLLIKTRFAMKKMLSKLTLTSKKPNKNKKKMLKSNPKSI